MDQLTFLQEETLANHIVSPDSKAARTMTVTSGRKCCALLKSQSPLGTLVKMLLVSPEWGSKSVLLTWKPKDMKCRRLIFQLAPSMPRTGENESGFWRTPASSDGEGGNMKMIKGKAGHYKLRDHVLEENKDFWPTPKSSPSGPDYARIDREGSGGDDLVTAVKRAGMLPTPTNSMRTVGDLEQAKFAGNDPRRPTYEKANKLLPTPRASDHKGSGPVGSKSQEYMEKKSYLCATVATEESGKLNPTWVEWVMGYHEGWTDFEA